MEGHSAVPKFDPFGEPSTLGPRWTRWLSGFELFADGKGLIIEQLLAGATAESVQRQHVVRQRRRALLLHSAGPDVQDIFLTLTDTGERREYDVAVTALNNYFVPKANAALARQVFHGINPEVKAIEVRVTDVGRKTTILGTLIAQPSVKSVQNATRETTLRKYVIRSESTVSTLVTLTMGTKMALLAEVQTGTTTSMRLGSVSTQ